MIAEKTYQEILLLMPRPCVDIVFVCGDEVLLLKRSIEPLKGYWALPGGMVYKGETTEKAAIRKAKEELGIEINIEGLKQIRTVSYLFPERQDICTTYKYSSSRFDIKLDSQHESLHWFSRYHLPKEIHESTVKQVLSAFGGAY